MSEYTAFEKLNHVRGVILKRAAEVFTYKNWSEEFAAKHIRELPELLKNPDLELTDIQPCELTNEECDILGFGTWAAENPMRLIPLWTFPFLADKIKFTCIDGSDGFEKSKMDNDNRFGYLACGIIPCDIALEANTK